MSKHHNTVFLKTGNTKYKLENAKALSYYTKFFDIKEQDWDAHLNTNLKGAFFLGQTVAKQMVDNKISGSIINIGSIAGSQSNGLEIVYSSFEPRLLPALRACDCSSMGQGLAASIETQARALTHRSSVSLASLAFLPRPPLYRGNQM